jgi:hypothetical protein
MYTKIGLIPSLDHFIIDEPTPIGLIRINVCGDVFEIIDGLSHTLDKQLVECLITNVSPTSRPTNTWIQLIQSIEHHGYTTYDIGTPTITKADDPVGLMLFNLENIHQITETTLLFVKKNMFA